MNKAKLNQVLIEFLWSSFMESELKDEFTYQNSKRSMTANSKLEHENWCFSYV